MPIHKIYEPIVEKFKLRLQKVLSNVQWHFGLGHLQKLGFHQKHNLPTLLKKSIENQVWQRFSDWNHWWPKLWPHYIWPFGPKSNFVGPVFFQCLYHEVQVLWPKWTYHNIWCLLDGFEKYLLETRTYELEDCYSCLMTCISGCDSLIFGSRIKNYQMSSGWDEKNSKHFCSNLLIVIRLLVYNRNHSFGLDQILRPKPKLANTFSRYRNWYWNDISN